MKKKAVALLACSLLWLPLALAQPQAPLRVASGTVRRFADFPSKHVAPRNVDVWLPEGYDGKKRYAVLYMHDGQMLFDSAATWNHSEWRVDETAGKLLKEKKIRPVIVVGAWNVPELRRREYAPQKAFNYLSAADQQLVANEKDNRTQQSVVGEGLLSDNYLKFLVTELKPFVDSVFSTRKDKKNTFVAGSSMGGLISMYAICEYPEVFGGAACLSTHWVGPIFRAENNPVPAALLAYLKDHLPAPETHKIYFDHGTVALDALYPTFQKQADEVMRSKGFSNKNWMTRAFEGKDHSERAWAERLDVPLVFLLKK
jgi:enterochelin esterase-like enzyme